MDDSGGDTDFTLKEMIWTAVEVLAVKPYGIPKPRQIQGATGDLDGDAVETRTERLRTATARLAFVLVQFLLQCREQSTRLRPGYIAAIYHVALELARARRDEWLPTENEKEALGLEGLKPAA